MLLAAVAVLPSSAGAQAPDASGPLAGLSLVDASDQTLLASLGDGDTVTLDDPDGGSHAIRADIAAGQSVGSVYFELAGAATHTQTENIAPYAIYGDHRVDGQAHLHGRALPAGDYTLTVTAYGSRRRGGDTLGTLDIAFTVAQTAAPVEPAAVEVPGAPVNLTASSVAGAVNLGWESPSGAAGITGYRVLRRELHTDPPEELAVLVTDTGSAVAAYTDTSVEAGTAYEYQVKAINSAGAGAGSATVEVTTVVGITVIEPDADDDLVSAEQSATEIWNTTLTVRDKGNLHGCIDGHRDSESCEQSLADDEFTYNGTTYTMRDLYIVDGRGRLIFETDQTLKPLTAVHMTLHIGSESFDFADAGSWHGEYADNYYWWAGTGLDWSEGDTVNLRLTAFPNLADGVVTASVDNLHATVNWGEVLLRWDALDSDTIKRCTGANGEFYFDIYQRRGTKANEFPFWTLQDPQVSERIVSELASHNTHYRASNVNLNRHWRFYVETVCKTADGTARHLSTAEDLIMPAVPGITNLRGWRADDVVSDVGWLTWDISPQIPASTDDTDYDGLTHCCTYSALGFQIEKRVSGTWTTPVAKNSGRFDYHDPAGKGQKFRVTAKVTTPDGTTHTGTTSNEVTASRPSR